MSHNVVIFAHQFFIAITGYLTKCGISILNDTPGIRGGNEFNIGRKGHFAIEDSLMLAVHAAPLDFKVGGVTVVYYMVVNSTQWK